MPEQELLVAHPDFIYDDIEEVYESKSGAFLEIDFQEGGVRMSNIACIMNRYNSQQVSKIKDFILSEIDSDNIEETIDFVKSNNQEKMDKFQDILYDGGIYSGLFIEENQYLISSSDRKVLIIDAVSEENGVDKELTRIECSLEDFTFLLSNIKDVLRYEEF